MQAEVNLSESFELAEKLLDRDVTDAESFLGIQAERLNLSVQRIEKGTAAPPWSNQEAYDKVASDQRASLSDLLKYAEKGKSFLYNYLSKNEAALRQQLCQGKEVRKEVKELEKDVKDMLKEMIKILVGVMLTNLPAGLLGAAGGLAAGVAVVLFKNKIETFCEFGFNHDNQQK